MPTNNTSQPHAGRVALVTGTSRGIGQAIAVGMREFPDQPEAER